MLRSKRCPSHLQQSEEELLPEIGAHSPLFMAFKIQHVGSVILNQPLGVFVKSCGSQQETEIIVAILNRKGFIPGFKKEKEKERTGGAGMPSHIKKVNSW